jgi:type I restriction enzyme, S subunit
MAVWSALPLSALSRGMRLDAEFYQPRLLTFEEDLASSGLPVEPLGAVARGGSRVIYQNTEVFDGDELDDRSRYVRFLQATDIKSAFPAITRDALGWVARGDWATYEKGRIRPGEILIEVKGKAEKVAVVPDDFPLETLVTGSVFKFLVDEKKVNRHYLLAYLLSKYGRGFRERCLTNTLIGFVNKDDLYAIPVPIAPSTAQRSVGSLVATAIKQFETGGASIASADALLLTSLGLDHTDLSPSRSYSRSFKDLIAGHRFGAEYYMPCKQRALSALTGEPHKTLRDHAPNIRDLWQPERAAKGAMVRNFDLGDALEPFLDDTVAPMPAAEVGSSKKQFKPGDVVVSRLRSYLREIAVVRTTNGVPCVGSSEFIVLRPTGKGLSAETILVYLRCPLVQTILKWSQDGSNHPRFDEDDLMALPVPDRLMKVSAKIEAHVHDAITARQEATRLLEKAKKAVEDLIAEGGAGKGR